MPSTKKTSAILRQGTLPFASKRAAGPSSPAKKRRTVSSRPRTDDSDDEDDYADITVLSDSEDEEPQPKEDATDKEKNEETRPIKPIPVAFKPKTRTSTEKPSKEEQLPQLNVSDRKWSKIHKASQQAMGYMTPIHNEGQNRIHQILRVFDMTDDYGPCTGISRLQRWERAEKLGMNPPSEVRDILLTEQGKKLEEYSQSVLYVPEIDSV